MITHLVPILADFTDGPASWPMAACFMAIAIGAVGIAWALFWGATR